MGTTTDLATSSRSRVPPQILPNIDTPISRDELRELGLSSQGIDYVLEVVNSPPSRKVGTVRGHNLLSDVPLHALGYTVQAESMTGEHFFLIDLIGEGHVRGIYDQPLGIPLAICDVLGRRSRINYTADFLVIAVSSVVIYEIKEEEKLAELCRKRDVDWIHREGRYHYLPAIELFGRMGIKHVTVSTAQLNNIRSDNYRLLHLVRRALESKSLAKKRKMVLSIVTSRKAVRAGEVLKSLDSKDATPILQCIDRRSIFVAFDRISLSRIDDVWLCTSLEIAENLQENDQLFLRELRASRNDAIKWFNAKYEKLVAERFSAINGCSREQVDTNKKLSARSIRRHKAAYRSAGNDLKSLQPKWANCGNRDQRLSNIHRCFLINLIHIARSDHTCPTVHKSYLNYVTSFRAQSELFQATADRPVARSTFYRFWNELPGLEQDAYKKGGRRLQNREREALDPIKRGLIASRPYSIAYIDHWKLDLFVVIATINGQKLCARPWLTAMIDEYTGEVLAIWLSFSDPSKKACSMVIRDCVRRHARMPEIIITDGGSEFHSPHFLLMLASLGVARVIRPPEEPRFGTRIERLFGTFRTAFARGLPGYGLSIDESRAVSGSMKSPKKATLTLLQTYQILNSYVFDGYNATSERDQLVARTESRQQFLEGVPWCGVQATTNIEFIIATAIEAPSDSYTIVSGRGIQMNNQWYSSPRILEYRGFKKDIAVRIEPYDQSVIYACVDGKWLICHSSRTKLRESWTDREALIDATKYYDLQTLRSAIRLDADMAAAQIINNSLDVATSKESQSKTNPAPGGNINSERL